MCATVYAMQVERIQAERQLAVVLIGAGADMSMPSVEDFDVAIGMTEPVDPWAGLPAEERELRRELGLRG